MITFGLLSALIFGILSILVTLHFIPCLRELETVVRNGLNPRTAFSPDARVILCVRGADPFLDRCLNGLATQDYPRYKVLIIVDSPRDEALPQLRKWLRATNYSHVELIIRDRTLPNSSRKASSLFCGLTHVPSEVEVVATCDADAIPHSTWLQELIAPMSDPNIVATSGNRWYVPVDLSLGVMVRYFWNVLAFRSMYQYQVPWGGSLAMRGDLFRSDEYLDSLKHAFSEDTALAGSIAGHKTWRALPIVSLVMLNEETIGLRNFFGFLTRQMLAARLHHPHWRPILFEAITVLIVMWVLLPLSALEGPASLALWMAGGLIYDASVLYFTIRFENLMRAHLLATRSQPLPRFTWTRLGLAPLHMMITGLVYSMAVFHAVFTRTHEWRGVVYRIENRGVSTIHERLDFGSSKRGVTESI